MNSKTINASIDVKPVFECLLPIPGNPLSKTIKANIYPVNPETCTTAARLIQDMERIRSSNVATWIISHTEVIYRSTKR